MRRKWPDDQLSLRYWDPMLIDPCSVYFSVVTSEAHRATRFCENLKDAADLVKQIVLG